MPCCVTVAQQPSLLHTRLQRRISAIWDGQELAVALTRLSDAGGVPLWLDRRVDRQQTLHVQLTDVPLQTALEKIAHGPELGVVPLGDLLYIGPRQATADLPALAERAREMLRKVPTQARRAWLRPQPTQWPRLSEPRKLANDWLKEAHIQVLGDEQITHDLWPAQSLPASPLVDRIVLLLLGFDRTLQIAADGKSCQIIPIPRPLKKVRKRTHSASQTPNGPNATNRKNPNAKKRQHNSHQVYSLRLDNQPVGRVLEQFAKQLQLEIVWPNDTSLRSNSPRKRLVTCNVQNAELDELLRKILAPAGLQHRREGKKITIQLRP